MQHLKKDLKIILMIYNEDNYLEKIKQYEKVTHVADTLIVIYFNEAMHPENFYH